MEEFPGVQAAGRYIAARAFRPRPPGPVGVEIEFFVRAAGDPARLPTPEELRGMLAGLDLPGASAITFEPGGQLELSSPPADSAPAAISRLAADIAAVEGRLATAGLALHGGGIEASRSPRRLVGGGRYDAMAAHFAECSPAAARAAPVMMTATAALQLNLEAGADEARIAERWRAAHLLGPVLAAAFACSPVLSGRATGVASARLQAWGDLEPCRTVAVPDVAPGAAPREQWARYALDATVLLVPDAAGGHRPQGRFTLAAWLADPALAGRPATRADIDYHLSTLFPPVRPRGFLELRYLDGQRSADWPVPVAVVAALHDDPAALRAAAEACAPAAGRWGEAARCGLADRVLGPAARDCLALAGQALARAGAPEPLRAQVATFAARYTDRGRCPADDLDAGVPDLVPPAAPQVHR